LFFLPALYYETAFLSTFNPARTTRTPLSQHNHVIMSSTRSTELYFGHSKNVKGDLLQQRASKTTAIFFTYYGNNSNKCAKKGRVFAAKRITGPEQDQAFGDPAEAGCSATAPAFQQLLCSLSSPSVPKPDAPRLHQLQPTQYMRPIKVEHGVEGAQEEEEAAAAEEQAQQQQQQQQQQHPSRRRRVDEGGLA